MKRRTAWLFALVILLSLSACKGKSGGTASPVNITVSPTPYSPHISENAADVSGEYADKLSSYAWLDTNDFYYYSFAKDGTFQHFSDKSLTEVIGSGKWQMKRDEQGYLTLHMEVDGGESFDLYDLDLYDESIYAHSLTETSYIWLLCNPKEE